MNDLSIVQKLSCLDQLPQIALSLQFGYSFPSFNQLVERLIVTQLKYHVHIILVFKCPLKLDTILTPLTLDSSERFMYLYLAFKL